MNRDITAPATADHPSGGPYRTMRVQLSSTPRGARLARVLASAYLQSWGLPCEDAALVVAELASNAALHGRVPGRDFALKLTAVQHTVRIEVADARAEAVPAPKDWAAAEYAMAEWGRGLLLVDALADRWGVTGGKSSPTKTVWAELTTAT